MRLLKLKTGSTPIGLEIGECSVRAVQFSGRGRASAVRAQALVPVNTAENTRGAYLAALRSILSQGTFRGRKVSASLPSSDVLVRPLYLPEGMSPDDAQRFENSWRVEARACLPFDPREAVMDCLPLGFTGEDGTGQYGVLLVAARRPQVEMYMQVIKEAGLQCQHLEIAATAVARVLKKYLETYAFVDFDEHQTVISIARGPRLLFSRVLKQGLRNLVTAVADNLDIPPAQAQEVLGHYGVAVGESVRWQYGDAVETGLVPRHAIPGVLAEICHQNLSFLEQEIQRTLRYFALQPGGKPVEKVVAGAEWLPPNILDHLGARLKLPVDALDGETAQAGGAYIKAAGLALWP